MTSLAIRLPDATGRPVAYALKGRPIEAAAGPHQFNRTAIAAVHVVADPFARRSPVSARPSTGTRRWPSAATSSTSASASRRRWTRPSAAWGSTGRRRAR